MIENKRAGFEELEHTADLEIQVWGEDLDSLFRQSAAGMIQLSGVEGLVEGISSVQQNISLEAMDYEGLLILFLEELLYRLTEDYMVYEIQELAENPPPEDRSCSCLSALDGAIITNLDLIPAKTRAKLSLLVSKYLEE